MAKSANLDLTIRGVIIDPEVYLKVVNHELRKKILYELFTLSLQGPVSKADIADNLGIGYHQMLYQLNEHLRSFWEVDHEEKVRGAREEFIRPKGVNTVFCLMGSDGIVHIADPLANKYGKVLNTGVRCDDCPQEQVKRCMDFLKVRPCLPQVADADKRKQIILTVNNRPAPYKPVDQVLICTLIKSLENECCNNSLECPEYIGRALKKG